MKLLPWNTAFLATRQERKFREASDLADIRLILKWLEKNDCMIKFPRIDQKLRKIYLTALGNLYLNDNETRAMICNTVTPGQMTAALVLNGCSGHFEDD